MFFRSEWAVSQASGNGARTHRRRGAALEAAILQAAWAELADVGYQRLTMEAVAARAETGKQVLYRRWHNRAELVIAALRRNTGSIVDSIPNTGSLRGDVLAVLRHMAQRQHDVSPDTFHGLLAEASELPPGFLTIMDGVMDTLLQRAADHGECDPATLSPRVISLPATLVRYEILITNEPIMDSTLVGIVDDVFLPLVTAKASDSRVHLGGQPARRVCSK